MKRILSLLLTVSLVTQALPLAFASDFSDVPQSHWAYSYINKLRELNITDGIGDNMFAPGKTLTRAEFAAFMCKVMDWELVTPSAGRFTDNKDKSKWYFPYIETALSHGAITSDTGTFRPDALITREEMAVMLVRALGYDTLASSLSYLDSPFTDVVYNKGYITIASDFGIITGVGGGKFSPNTTALREHAAAMLIRMYNGLHTNVTSRNAFYAISSASQMDRLADFDSACFGWARLTVTDGVPELKTTTANGNEYYLPQGYASPYGMAAHGSRYLFVAVSDAQAAEVLSGNTLRAETARLMAQATSRLEDKGGGSLEFDGVVVDFEGLKGETNKQNLNLFLAALRGELDANNKKMIVAVHPKRRTSVAYYDGYDYKTIGEYADRVILMAHDYNAKQLTASDMERGVTNTPLAPIDDVYYALRAITNPTYGVQQHDKIMLQISYGSAQWKLQNGKVINEKPYTPSYDAIKRRINSGAVRYFDQSSKSPYIKFFNQDDQTDNIVWYEDAESTSAKVSLAKMFGVTGISVWRLGLMQEDVKF